MLAADALRSFRAQQQKEPWSDLPKRAQFIFKTLFVSICHQFNWDFLQGAMANWILPDPESRLAALSSTRPSDIARLLSGYSKPERIRAEQRARMLRTTAAELRQLLRSGKIDSLIATPRLAGPGGFYDIMTPLSAFSEDELEKKVRVLAHDLHRETILKFDDPVNLKPAIEYHLIRLYIRSGRVYPTSQPVRDHLTNTIGDSRPRLVRLLRKAVEEAMTFTSLYAGMDIATLNYVEWQIGRSICIPDIPPYCSRPPVERMPTDIETLSPCRCIYAGFCRSYTDSKYGWYNEPRFQKAIY